MQTKQSPVFTKTYDLLKWLVPHVGKYPKSQRFRLAKRIEDAAFDFHGLLIQATKEGNPRRILLRADAELDKLRHYIRLGMDLGYTSHRQYSHVAQMLVEVGKLLGGWLNSLEEQKQNMGSGSRAPARPRHNGTLVVPYVGPVGKTPRRSWRLVEQQ